MDQNATIEAMLTRELSMADFTARLDTDEELEASLRNLVPPDALDNPSHLLWSQLSYSAMQESHFDCLELLDRLCRYDGSLGDNLNIFDFIRRIYCCRHPELTCTSFYQDAFDLYLDAVGDRFEGPEVQTLVEEIITGALAIQGKGKRVQYAKEKVREAFHVTNRNWPRWIQGPEWPMGTHSPMAYVSKKRRGQRVEYTFRDVDTGEIRVVEQYD